MLKEGESQRNLNKKNIVFQQEKEIVYELRSLFIN